jgi:flavodoxin
MTIEVRYQSRKGNTKKVAEAIAAAVSAEAQPIDAGVGAADVLFLGGGLYAGKPDKALTALVGALDGAAVKKIALFSTSASGKDLGAAIKEIAAGKGIAVYEKTFSCRGKFLFMGRKHPDTADLTAAAEFAKEVISEIEVISE